jgi:hypothetical protein
MEKTMKKFVIERVLPGVGAMSKSELQGAAQTSNSALSEMGPRIQWQHSYVAGDRTYCVYLAENEDAIREHSKRSGFPANRITEVDGIIDPTTASAKR